MNAIIRARGLILENFNDLVLSDSRAREICPTLTEVCTTVNWDHPTDFSKRGIATAC